jgi:hypothetical protein
LDDLTAFEQSGAYTEFEKEVLRFAEQWTGSGRVDLGVVQRLLEQLSPQHLVLLAATVGQANFTGRFNLAFGVELP